MEELGGAGGAGGMEEQAFRKELEEQGCREELEEQGFIMLRHFLKEEEVEEVKANLDRSHPTTVTR